MQHKLTCIYCEEPFEARRSDAKFCSNECRYLFWFKKNRIPKEKYNTVYGLKQILDECYEEGRRIVRHFKKMEEEYEEWGNNLIAIQTAIQKKEEELGVSREELITDAKAADIDMFDDIFDEAPADQTESPDPLDL
jgi:predicted nucleic acid-binding Zn ribbon protein